MTIVTQLVSPEPQMQQKRFASCPGELCLARQQLPHPPGLLSTLPCSCQQGHGVRAGTRVVFVVTLSKALGLPPTGASSRSQITLQYCSCWPTILPPPHLTPGF